MDASTHNEKVVAAYVHLVNFGTEQQPAWRRFYFLDKDLADTFPERVMCAHAEPSLIDVVHDAEKNTYRRLNGTPIEIIHGA